MKDVKVQADGKIVLGGFLINNQNTFEMALARINSDGSIDNSFGTNGMVSFNIGNGKDFGEALAIQDDGKVIIAGYSVRKTE
ncbi:delta-60 repeat domain-containing protein [Aequorivita sinensis]|uniref:delta-60 repeat domain-containing protein n=1 Tax=Aequorivita sinensis TaxID=1382458 RepID=UPI002300E96F|nr:delta-60 repeat domain-containing protein [Aequorivita sinensis]